MDRLRPSSQAVWPPKEFMSNAKLSSAAVSNDSKAQHILGLSRIELQSARTQSLKSKASVQSLTSSETLSSRNPFRWRRGRPARSVIAETRLPSTPSIATQQSILEVHDAASVSHDSSLRKYSFTSVAPSVQDTVTTSSQNNQHTPYSSSADLTIQEPHSSLETHFDQTMEPHGRRRLTKSPKTRVIGRNDSLDMDQPCSMSVSRRSSASRTSNFSSPSSKTPCIANVTERPSTPTPIDHQKSSVPSDFFSKSAYRKRTINGERSKAASNQNAKITIQTPFTKLNVRKPKAGTKNWFDDIEGISSDEEQYNDLQTNQPVVVRVECTFPDEHVQDSSVITDNTEVIRLKAIQPSVTEISGLIDDVASTKSETPPATSKTRVDELSTTRSRRNRLDQADLSQESVLNLSESEDEHVDEEREECNDVLWPLQPVQSFEMGPGIRKSLIVNSCDESEFEIGIAHTAISTGNHLNERPSPIKIVTSKRSSASSSPTTTPISQGPSEAALGYSRSGSPAQEHVKDAEEDALMDSFPATPTSPVWNRRVSARSSISIPDDRSVVSMKLMKVTRQEENLIAAMRKKRAAMKRAERAALQHESDALLDAAETESISRSRQQSLEFSTRFDDRLAEREMTEQKLSGLGLFNRTDHRRSQSITKMSGSAGRTESSDTRRPNKEMKLSLYPSTSSTSTSERCDSKLLTQGEFDKEPSTTIYRPRVFLERPFGSWERNDSTFVH